MKDEGNENKSFSLSSMLIEFVEFVDVILENFHSL